MDCSGNYTFTKTGGDALYIPNTTNSFYVNGTLGQSVTILITGSGTIGNRTVVFNF